MSDDLDVQQTTNDFSAMSLQGGDGNFPVDCMIGDNAVPIQFEHIAVHPPELRGATRFNQYHVYRITAIPLIADNIYRRYSEFEWLYDTLQSAYPGIFVPPLPPKKMMGNKDDTFIELQRRPALERFLNRIARIPVLADSQIFQVFLARTHSFDSAQKEVSKKLSARPFDKLLETYAYYYQQPLQQDLPHSIDAELTSISDFLKQREVQLAEIVNGSDELTLVFNRQLKALQKLSVSTQSLASIDGGFDGIPQEPRTTITDNFVQWLEDAKEAETRVFANLFQGHVCELEDTHQFIEVLSTLKSLKAKATKSQGKAQRWDAPGAKCVTEKDRMARAADIQTSEDDARLVDTLTKIIYFYQYHNVWRDSVVEYNSNVAQFAESQSGYAQRCYHNWDALNASKHE